MAEVAERVLHPSDAAGVAVRLFVTCHAAEGNHRAPPRLAGGQTVHAGEIFRFAIQMMMHLRVHVAINRRSAEEGAQAARDAQRNARQA
jgi:hypothetical protein